MMLPTKHQQSTIMRRFSTLAGPLNGVIPNQVYSVAYKRLINYDGFVYRNWSRFLAYGSVAVVLAINILLANPEHWLIMTQPAADTYVWSLIMLLALASLQIFLFIGTLAASRSTLKALDPVPVTPQQGLRVAFITTRAPGEPLDMVQTTLQAAKRMAYEDGSVDIWLLDETGSPELQAICREQGVRYFSRHGIARWNTKKANTTLVQRIKQKLSSRRAPTYDRDFDPVFAAKSKHGNINSWGEYLDEQGLRYDIIAGVDTDQVPEPNYLERLLGYFRDQDVAFVVGPQVYGNYEKGMKGLVSRWAESQASFFQSTIQRAGNANASPMFVGTNYAVRTSVLAQIGGFQPCITEDMATGLAIHANRNPRTGNRWKSVYTPDVLAVGEGPGYWAPYFTQQWRWAAGTYDTWKRMVWRVFFKLSPKSMFHYFLMLTFYPMAALTWLLGMVSSLIYLTTGATAVVAPWSQFVSLYLVTLILQLGLYFWNRRFNVSPHEPAGSLGVPGMVLTALTAPIYLSALIGIIIGKKPNFVVTTKGSSDNPDWFAAYRTHLQWAAVLGAGLIVGLVNGHHHPAMLLWVVTQFIICFLPFILGMSLALPARFSRRQPASILSFKSGELNNV